MSHEVEAGEIRENQGGWDQDESIGYPESKFK